MFPNYYILLNVSECSSGWKKLGTKCYKVFPEKEKKDWISSKENCSKEKGSLVTASKNLFHTLLDSLMSQAKVEAIWSGNRQGSECSVLSKFVKLKIIPFQELTLSLNQAWNMPPFQNSSLDFRTPF